MEYTWIDHLRTSSWVTTCWEWLQNFLGRAVDLILWITMIFACYQLIPGAPVLDAKVSLVVFVAQFIALDIGGMSLNQIAQQHGMDSNSFTRRVAYACIFVTLTTIVFAGIQHAIPNIPDDVTKYVEVALVIARSVLTVLYGQAVRAIKAVEHVADDRVAQLEDKLATLQGQFDTAQGLANELKHQLQVKEKAHLVLTNERDALSLQLDLKKKEASSVQEMLTGGQDWSQQQLSKLQERFDAEQEMTLKLRLQMQSIELQKNEMTAEIRTAKLQIEGLQTDLQEANLQVVKLQKTTALQTAKTAVRPAKLPANITAIEDAKPRIPNADILAYIASHPDLKRAEVAAELGISERKVYDAISWGRDQESEKVALG